jgi:3-methyl-2-oxobutanoate hydroxymethyltransferase
MSAHAAPTKRLTLGDLAAKKNAGERIVMVTAYDYPSAQIVEEAGVDMVLVGDSAAMTVLGYDSTVPITTDEMLMLTKAVRRGLTRPLLVGDLPFGSYEASDEIAISTAQRFIKEAGVDLVKIERGGTTVERARALVNAGIPVVGHVGLTPQTAVSLGGYRAQGRTADAALAVIEDALALQDAGVSVLVVEAVPSEVTAALMPLLRIPVIGIGAGAEADGQVLVFHDLLGIYSGGAAKFVKRYADVRAMSVEGVEAYADEVREGAYPAPEHGYGMPETEAARLLELLGERSASGSGHPRFCLASASGRSLGPRSQGSVPRVCSGSESATRRTPSHGASSRPYSGRRSRRASATTASRMTMAPYPTQTGPRPSVATRAPAMTAGTPNAR